MIKESSKITYYPLPYKKIPIIMIHNLVMNVARNVNVFPDIGEVSSHYRPYMILPQSNWGYNKNCQV